MNALKKKIQSAFYYHSFYNKANSTFSIFEWIKYKSGSKSYISLFLMCAVVSDIERPWPDQTLYLHWTDLRRSWTPPWLCWTRSYLWTSPPVWMWTDNHTPSERVISKHIHVYSVFCQIISIQMCNRQCKIASCKIYSILHIWDTVNLLIKNKYRISWT